MLNHNCSPFRDIVRFVMVACNRDGLSPDLAKPILEDVVDQILHLVTNVDIEMFGCLLQSQADAIHLE